MFSKTDKQKHYQVLEKNLWSHIWNLEFNIYELRTVREGYRLEYDKVKEAKSGLEERIKNLELRKAEGDDKEVEEVKKKIEEMDNAIKQWETQLKEVDQVIEGFDYTDPEGNQRHHDGVMEKIGKIHTKLDMLKEFSDKI